MSKLRWQLLIVIVALAAIALLLFSQQPSSRQVTVAPQPVKGGTFTEAFIGKFGRLNPTLDFYNQADRDADRLIFCSLIKYDDKGIPQADAAESWGISKDGTVYNFALRKNAVWHDGTPLTSEDVIFTLEVLKHPDNPTPSDLKDFWNSIEVVALDEKTIQFRLPEPFAPFLDYLSVGLLPKHLLANYTPKEIIDAPYNLMPVGCGPYRVQQLITEADESGKQTVKGLMLKAFDQFYIHAPYIQDIIILYYPDEQTALQAYKEGKVQAISQLGDQVIKEALIDDTISIYSTRLPKITYVILNLDNPEVPFFKEPEIRKALLLGINRQKIVDKVFKGQAIVAHTPIVPISWAYSDGIPQFPYNPEKAVSILKNAGYIIPASGNTRVKDEQMFSFELLYPETEQMEQVAKILQSGWANLQLDVKIKPMPYDQMITEALEPRKYQAAVVEINQLRLPDPDPYPFWHQTQATGGQNYGQWQDRQASEYLELARITTNIVERGRLYRNFQVRFASEMPALPLYLPIYNYGISKEVQGVKIGAMFDPSDRYLMVTDWYLVARTKFIQFPTQAK
jgi:peptide/nickel transport system substrate-binding protein